MDKFKALADVLIIAACLFYFGAGVGSNRVWMALLCLLALVLAWIHLNKLGTSKDR